jgi:predicted Zn-ribbon and HTH transcriptional regulator
MKKSNRMDFIANRNKERRFRGDRKKQISNLLSSMRMVRQIKELSETLSEEEKNKLAKELEKTIESIKRKLDRLK